MCVRMHTSHSIKQMAGRGSEMNKSCETRGIGVGQSESNGEEIWITGSMEDKVTKRAHKQKKAQVGKRFHEREGGKL